MHGIGKKSAEHPVADYASTQIRAICLLGKICRQIRNEAYAEFFHRTQLVCRRRTNSLMTLIDEPVMDIIFKSNLIQQNIRHVSFHWWRFKDFYLYNVLRLLARAPQLSTLEIVFTDPGLWSKYRPGIVSERRNEPVMEKYFDPRRYKLVLKGPPLSLDKITFKLDFQSGKSVEIWENTKWFQDIKRDIAKAHLKKEGERLDPEPCHAIDYYIAPPRTPLERLITGLAALQFTRHYRLLQKHGRAQNIFGDDEAVFGT